MCIWEFSLFHVLLSLKRGTVSARNITLLIDNCVNYYCGLLFNIFYSFFSNFYSLSGDTVKLIELLDEGLSRAEAILREKGRNEALTTEEFERVKRAVAYGCVKYADLSHDRWELQRWKIGRNVLPEIDVMKVSLNLSIYL